jgi:hypothetical protein
VLRIFIVLKNPSPWPGFEPASFGSSGKHTNHYTTKATSFLVLSFEMSKCGIMLAAIQAENTIKPAFSHCYCNFIFRVIKTLFSLNHLRQ